MQRIVYHIVVIISILLATPSCSKDVVSKDDLFCIVTLSAKPKSGENFVSIRIDDSLKGNFFQNINTGEKYTYPLFVNNSCTMRVLKGVYIFAFDAEGTLKDGTVKKVRCAAHRSPTDAVNLTEDTMEVEFEITTL